MSFSSKIKGLKFANVENTFSIIAAAAIAFILAITTANVIGRYLFNKPVPGTIEIAKIVIVLIIFLSTSMVQRMRLHIGMDTLLEVFKRKKLSVYYGIQIFNFIVFFGVMAIVGIYFVPSLMDSLGINEKTTGPLFIVVWPFKVAIIIGCGLICIRLLTQIYEHFKYLLGKSAPEAKKE